MFPRFLPLFHEFLLKGDSARFESQFAVKWILFITLHLSYACQLLHRLSRFKGEIHLYLLHMWYVGILMSGDSTTEGGAIHKVFVDIQQKFVNQQVCLY